MKKYSSTARGNYRRTQPKSRYLWLTVIAFIIGLAWIFPWLVSGVSSAVLYPFNAVAGWVSTSDGVVPEYLRSRSSLMEETDRLRAEIAAESSTKNSIDRLLEENMLLRGMVGASIPNERLVARVTARPTKLAYDLLQIDRGEKDGVQVGSPVYTGLDTVLGVVVYVTSNYSFVDLFTSPGFESTAYIIGPNVFATLEGMGGGVARVNLPQGVPIAEGQLVILPGVTNGVYGEIVYIDNPPTQPQQYGYIVPPQALSELFYVSVGLDSYEAKSETEIDEEIRTATREKFILDENIISNLEEFWSEATSTEATSTEDATGDMEGEEGGADSVEFSDEVESESVSEEPSEN